MHLIMQFEQITNNNNKRTQAQELKLLVLGGFLVDFVGLNTAPKRNESNTVRISQSCKTGKQISSTAHILTRKEGVNFFDIFSREYPTIAFIVRFIFTYQSVFAINLKTTKLTWKN